MTKSRTIPPDSHEALRLENECLKSQLAELRTALSEARAEIARLQAELAKAQKNSRNSSKPPSSDLVKPPRKTAQPNSGENSLPRPRGAQPGHARHQRPAFEASDLDVCWDYVLPSCPDCGGPVTPSDAAPRLLQQVELVTTPIVISEHRGQPCWCPNCRHTHYAPVDEDVQRAGLIGPRLTALVAYLKGGCHCSFSTICKFLQDVVRVTISRGQLWKLCRKVSDGLQPSYLELLDQLPTQPVLNVDETGHKDHGRRMWTWCFRAATFTLFKIDPSRGAQVLLNVLGEEFRGLLGCDYFSAYRKYMRLNENVLVQFCLAHLIRDLQFLVEHPDRRNRAYGRRVLQATREAFALFGRREELSARAFAGEVEDACHELCGAARFRVPRTREAQNLARRFWLHGDSYLRFLTTPGIEPTNNLAEQAIRFVVIDRKVTQGSRGAAGQRWLERIWTVMATCAQQGRSVFEFLSESVTALFQQQAPPSLVPDT